MTQSLAMLTKTILVASAAVIATASLSTSVRAAPGDTDVGPVDAASVVRATLWLKPHDEAAFERSVTSRSTPGSPDFHRWMSTAEAAASGPIAQDLATLVASLQATGLDVAARGDVGDALRVTGSARAMQSAFKIMLHAMRSADGSSYRRASGEPRFSGPGSDIIGGVTGFDSAPMRPLFLHQLNPTTGEAVAYPLTASHPQSSFTTQCFKPKETLSLTHFVPNGGSEHVKVTGPSYIATGVYPAKATCGYTPRAVAAHYGVTAAYRAGFEGQGQTIVLVDAYGSPTIQSDANDFSKLMNLPALDATNFQVIYPEGPPIANPYPTGWPLEISLDVEWAHAIAPRAKIVLVVAPADDADSLAYALHYAASHNLGEVISNSYGYPEAGYGPATALAFNMVIARAAAKGIAVNVSTGDSGDFGLGRPNGAASIPADSPFATGVGGTSVGVPSDGGPVESAWGSTETYLGDINGIPVPPGYEGFRQGGGGGQSGYFVKPRWQAALPGTGRDLPDVSAIADPFTGAIIVTPNGDGTQTLVEVIGGTSLSSPVFSGIWALADQAAGHRLGQAAPIIAKMPPDALRDILPVAASASNLSGTVGAGTQSQFYTPAGLLNLTAVQPNGFVGAAVRITSPTAGIGALFDISFGADSSLAALPGWDFATGYGVPNGLAFINAATEAK